MTLFTGDIPSADTAPSEPKPSQVRPLIERSRVTRRSVLRGVMNTGMVVGLTAIGLLIPGRKAFAADPYPTRRDCNYPNSWKGACNPDTDPPTAVGGQFCASHGWHRSDGRRINSCEYESYRIKNRCGRRPSGGNYNAWEWRRGQTGGNYTSARCSDGLVYVTDRCGPEWIYKSACRKLLPP